MQEKSLPRPLSGSEIRKAILHKIEQRMAQDCTLQDINAYPSFSFTADIEVHFQTLGRTDQTTVRAVDAGGEVVEGIPMEVQHVHVDEPMKTPNTVRQETGQEIPVAHKTASGKMEERRAKYAQPGFAVGKK